MVWAIWLPFVMLNRLDWNVNSSRSEMYVYVGCDCGNVFSMIAFAPVMDYVAHDVFDWNWTTMPMMRVYVSMTMMWSNRRFR